MKESHNICQKTCKYYLILTILNKRQTSLNDTLGDDCQGSSDGMPCSDFRTLSG